MKDIVAKITAVWESLNSYIFEFINKFVTGEKDQSLLGWIQEVIGKVLGTADVVADQVEEAE